MNDLYIPQLTEADIKTRKNTRKLRYSLALAGIFLFVGATARILLNVRDAKALEDYTAQAQMRSVLITAAKPGELQRNIALPSSLRGNTEAVIYSRGAGYVTAWHKGIGDSVKKGDLLASIDAPEQEQELAQARAQREQYAARLELGTQTLARWEALQQRQTAISQQDLDEKRSLVRQGRADLAAADANVKRLEQLESFRHIQAPFNGIITRRSIEVGDLIASGGRELFALTQTDPLRLTIWVPQAYAMDVKVGGKTSVNLKEQPGKPFLATVERVAGGIDRETRARQVDLILPNPGATLLPGAYAEVSIALSSGINALIVPASVLLINDQGPRVAIVDKDNHVHFQNIKLGRDLGRDIEILDGIAVTDQLIVSPSDQLVDGEQVKTIAWQPVSGGGSKDGKKDGQRLKENEPSKEKGVPEKLRTEKQKGNATAGV